MQLNEKINEHTILYYIEDNVSHEDEEGNDVVDIYALSFKFYDCNYMVYVRRENLNEEMGYTEMEGDSRLFESFENFCEDDYWEQIKEKCKQYDQWLKEMFEG